ncbi:MAG: AAA family ATPase [Alistipes sp.]
MKKETLFVALSNQKGGVGKSAFTILLASYFHYVKKLNVAVVDCDSPQHSLSRMRERDKQTVSRSDYFKQLVISQWEQVQRKAYPIVNATADKAREVADALVDGATELYDVILVDLPGTVEAQGVFRTIINMDYVITPIIADRMAMQSSLSFSTTVLDYVQGKSAIPLKGIWFFWNRVDRRTSTEVFDVYNQIMVKLNLTVLDTVIPETCRYDKELSMTGRTYFRSTMFPPPAKLLKGSGLEELAEEIIHKLNL